MPTLNLKPTHKMVKDYCTALEGFVQLGMRHEGTARTEALGIDGLPYLCGRLMPLDEATTRTMTTKPLATRGSQLYRAFGVSDHVSRSLEHGMGRALRPKGDA